MNIEEDRTLSLDFQKLSGIARTGSLVLPVVVQDAVTREVLVLAYVNQEALEKTLSSGIVTFWSTSRNELWVKGKTSGQFLTLVEARVNCEQNSLLFLVTMQGSGSCHTRGKNGTYRKSCYYRKISGNSLEFLKEEAP